MGTELRSLFHSKEGQQSLPSCSNNGASNTIMGQGESLLSRAGRLCQHLRPGKRVRKRERARVSSLMTSRNLKTSSYGKMAAKNRHSREVGRVSPQRLAAATNRNRHQ